uniref:WD_REPEATS_REGION domain-containing protein n=1 Tax=Heterorhabditis bacteriophora TaxID=37862 RepID=A0A1I7WMQ1_HETBA
MATLTCKVDTAHRDVIVTINKSASFEVIYLLRDLASADSSVGLLTFNPQTAQWSYTKIVKAHEQGVNAVSWAPALHTSPLGSADQPIDKRIVTCGNDKLVKIWMPVELFFFDSLFSIRSL